MLRNPDGIADIKLAAVILLHFPVHTENGLEIRYKIFKYCYLKDNWVHFFIFDEITGNYITDKDVTLDQKEQMLNLFRRALNGKEVQIEKRKTGNGQSALRFLRLPVVGRQRI
jgi:hypothetical protein